MTRSIAPRSLRALELAVEGYAVVSLDVFDTALVRCVARPEDVFAIVDREYRRAVPEHASSTFDFASERVDAEERARAHARRTLDYAEITLSDIYQHVQLPAGWSSTTLVDLEMSVERACARANPLFLELVLGLARNGRRVVFVSDMYLPAAFIRSLLVDAGYPADIALFVSSDHRDATKGNGRLFDRMTKSLGVFARDVVHIGDNRASDVVAATRAGISAMHYPKCIDFVPAALVDPSTTEGSVVAGMIAARCHADDATNDADRFERAGYEVFGPAVLGFAEFVRAAALRDRVSRLFFLARDGQIVRDVYSMLLAAGYPGPDATYLLASRRAMNVASMTSFADAEIEFILGGMTPLSAAALLERIGVDPRIAMPHLAAAGIASIDETIARPHASDEMRRLLRAIEPEILAAAAHERDVLRRYLGVSEFLSTDSPAVVDLGWHGTLQKSLESFAADARWAAPLRGYYLGTVRRAAQVLTDGSPSRGFLFEMGVPSEREDVISRGMAIVELAHAADHGTLVRFRDNGGSIEPVLDEADLTPDRMACASAVQAGIRRFARDALEIRRRFEWFEVQPGPSFESLRRMIMQPSPWEARAFGELMHVGGFGATRVGKKIASPPTLVERILVRRARRTKRRDAYWKEGFDVRFENEATVSAVASNLASRITRRFRCVHRRRSSLDGTR